MTSQGWNWKGLAARGLAAAGGFALSAGLLVGCGGGGGGLVAPDEATAMSVRDQAALNRATQLNADALSRVKGERATGATAP